MKKRIGAIKGKPIVEGCNFNTLTNNEILVEDNKIIYRENGKLKELGNNEDNNNNSNSSSSRLTPSDIVSISQLTYTMNNYGDATPDETYDITSLISYSEELGVFVISKADYDTIKQRNSYNGEFYFLVKCQNFNLTYNVLEEDSIAKSITNTEDFSSHIFYYSIFSQSRFIEDFKNYYREFYLMVL